MKYFIVFFLLIGLSDMTQAQKKKSVAVLEFQSSGMEHGEATTLTNRFRGMLVETDAFNVVEQEKMAEVLKAQDFILSDNCNSAECAVQVGQLLGVEAMIGGNIGKVGKTWTIDLRLIDVTTSKILKSKSQNYRGEADGLIDIMTDIAYAFAGKKNPHPRVNESVSNIAEGKPGRIKIELMGGLLQGKKFPAGGGVIISIGYMLTSHLKVAIQGGINGYTYGDTITIYNTNASEYKQVSFDYSDNESPLLLSATWNFATGSFKPFINAGVGIARFSTDISTQQFGSEIKSVIKLKKGSHSYVTAGTGFEFDLSHSVAFDVFARRAFTKLNNFNFIGAGIVFSVGNALN